MLKMKTKTPVTPSSLLVKGINAKVDYDWTGRGGSGFVFKGAAVALKLLFKARHNDARHCLILNEYRLLIAVLIGFLLRSVDVEISKSRARPATSRDL